MANTATDYMNPDVPGSAPTSRIKLVKATNDNLEGYGCLVDDYNNFKIEIVTWPKVVGRPIDNGTGNQGGTKEGIFYFGWQGDVFFGKNNAVNDEYLLGWSTIPAEAKAGEPPTQVPDKILLWHANYHPDGGQLFYPLDGSPYVVPLALPGDNITPEDFIAFYFDGSQGLYIHPNVWHEGIFPLVPQAGFYDAQGAIHARVSVNFPKEFGVFLEVPMNSLDQ